MPNHKLNSPEIQKVVKYDSDMEEEANSRFLGREMLKLKLMREDCLRMMQS